MDAQSDLNDLVIDYIKLLKDDYLNTVDQVLKELEKGITGFSLKDLETEWERISDEDFLANRGVANEVRYYVFDYEPCDESTFLTTECSSKDSRRRSPTESGSYPSHSTGSVPEE